ncbi:BZ3500_MvSof-1268-A1-R1_Chr3-2g06293 [Microbotryum saponariae]|uniref:BZ3500_MvSof-1268-A1-R1_Chr3-2g06293 protein n=1 Tax=Microbotryum saponariae TaxID=289078 RepID=A0A2X0KVT0_9BASI|nr:BZ3500_MvSof-1268-A1-R1_Chr3-2g06293 [Microbotryum saponariae]SDA04264.1 BZ3501_MvSof-1269-A2-R1_Chr3-2g05984 [Microbotryum saponariae]
MNALKRWSSNTNDLHQHLSAPVMPGSSSHSSRSHQSSPHLKSPNLFSGGGGGPWSGSNFAYCQGGGGMGNGTGGRSPHPSPGLSSPYNTLPSNGYPFPDVRSSNESAQQGSTGGGGPRIDRAALHRSLSAWSTLLAALDDYRVACSTMASVEKSLVKALKEMAGQFGEKVEFGSRNEAVATGLLATLVLFDGLQDVDQKHAKSVQREYEALNSLSATFFKQIAKEEKFLEESLTMLDGKMAKVSASYERSRPIGNHRRPNSLDDVHSAAAAHEKYIATLSNLSSSVTGAKTTHAENTGNKRDRAALEVARGLCLLGEAAWRNRVDATRKTGSKVGNVVLMGTFCEQNMPPLPPLSANKVDGLGVGIGAVGTLEVGAVLGPRLHRIESEVSQATSSAFTDHSSGSNAPLPSPGPSSIASFSQERLHQSLPQAPVASNSNHFDGRGERSDQHPPQLSRSYQYHLPPTPQGSHASSQLYPSSTGPPSPSPNDDHAARLNKVTSESASMDAQPQQLEVSVPRPPPIAPAELAESVPPVPFTQRTAATRWNSATSNHDQKYPLPASHPNREQIESPMDPNGPLRRTVPAATQAPPQSHEQPGRPVSRPLLTRNESTASERSFVAQMRAKYLEEKDRMRQAGPALERGYHEVAGSTSAISNSPASHHPRSGSRVSQIAQRYNAGAASNPSPRFETT